MQNEEPNQQGADNSSTSPDHPSGVAVHHLVISQGDDDDHIALYLRRVPFAFTWWFAMLCHAGCAAFLCSTTAIYVFLGGINMIYYNKLLGSTLRKDMGTLGYWFIAIAGLHFLEMLRMLWHSLRARKLTFNPIKPLHKAVAPAIPVSAGGPRARGLAHLKKLRRRTKLQFPLLTRITGIHPPKNVVYASRRIKRLLLRVKKKLFDRKQGLLGLESPYFNLLFLLRETVEIASQSYQMYQCSKLISSAWINNLFLGITVLNCWSTPILQHALAHFNALERVICLTLDSLLDAGTCMLIPVIIVMKYVYAFDRSLLEFPVEKLTDPQWFTALILENRMLFAMNRTDLFTTLMPHYSLFGCLRKVKRLIQRMPPEFESVELEVSYVNSMRVLVPKTKDGSSAHQGLKQTGGEMPGWKRRFVHFFFIGWGATVLGVHIRARQIAKRYASVVACKQPLRPWFAKSFMCASFQFDCVEQGNIATITAADLSLMDATTLSSLVISNCPALEVPDIIQDFSGLLKVMVYNSTIVSWPSSASLNAEDHASLISISVIASNMSSFPEGLQAEQPESLQDVHFAKTNLTSLPSELSKGWRVSKISFEYCEFTEFPSVFLDLRVDELSLAGNQFTKISNSMSSMSTSYDELVLGDNAFLAELPSSGLPKGTKVLSIENTAISELPSAMTTASNSSSAATVGTNTVGTSTVGTNTVGTNTGGSGGGEAAGTSSAAGSAGGNSTAITRGSSGATGGAGGGQSSPLSIYASDTPLCEKLGGADQATNAASVTVYCSTKDPNGVSRFPLAWMIDRFQPSA